MTITDVARVWINARHEARVAVRLGWYRTADDAAIESEVAKAEILARLAALQVSA